jgi:hypothetical protein
VGRPKAWDGTERRRSQGVSNTEKLLAIARYDLAARQQRVEELEQDVAECTASAKHWEELANQHVPFLRELHKFLTQYSGDLETVIRAEYEPPGYVNPIPPSGVYVGPANPGRFRL